MVESFLDDGDMAPRMRTHPPERSFCHNSIRFDLYLECPLYRAYAELKVQGVTVETLDVCAGTCRVLCNPDSAKEGSP